MGHFGLSRPPACANISVDLGYMAARLLSIGRLRSALSSSGTAQNLSKALGPGLGHNASVALPGDAVAN